MEYYIYVYLDPRKPGTYKYGDYEFEYEPFYLGRGKNNRCNWHYNQVFKGKFEKSKKNQKIQKLINGGYKPIILKLVRGLSLDDANKLEIEYIKTIGRLKLKSGPLCNITEGGEGGDTYSIQSKERQEEISAKRSNSMMGKNKDRKLSSEHIEKIRKAKKGVKRPRQSELMKGRTESIEHKNKISEGLKKAYVNGERQPINTKKILQFDLECNLLNEYSSGREAARSIGLNEAKPIYTRCNNKRKSNKFKGFIWKWKK